MSEANVDLNIEVHGTMMEMAKAVEENLWPVLFMRIPPEVMARFEQMTVEVPGDALAKFEYLMNEAGWGE